MACYAMPCDEEGHTAPECPTVCLVCYGEYKVTWKNGNHAEMARLKSPPGGIAHPPSACPAPQEKQDTAQAQASRASRGNGRGGSRGGRGNFGMGPRGGRGRAGTGYGTMWC
uniref:Uncharacterized protein n=1 Tax=Chromera velia CCMP2878 TaxID=1169474 RepID=A0A0G4H4G9_9ALVE|eukprot:Cvel_5690.t1-p1 / transcript=Cvel_5690.t1 / gene=Cvel_5690 / organism=Chromera_velia_CCMP2878 / gene_product=hypothetical protein / transcript_product=hypothetical protein / location=Cvel_scaffold269:30080-30412(-) / protein_length=111 / sequence_SO=supercontig / SO=protein_coding / is_pseudo=false